MNDSVNTTHRSRIVGGTAFLILFLIPAALTYFDEPPPAIMAVIGLREDIDIFRWLCYGLMLLVCTIRAPFVHRWWLPALPAVAAVADLSLGLVQSIWLIGSIVSLVPSLANLIALAAGLAPASTRYERETQVLVDGLVRLAPDLRSVDDARAVLDQANAFATEDDTRDKWRVSRWLIDTRKSTSQQLLIAQACLERASRLAQLQGDDADVAPALSGAYQEVLGTAADLTFADLVGGLDAHLLAWRQVADAVRRISMPRVFLTEAFFRISERRGIQIASMVTAGLVVLGAIYMTRFYDAAVGIAVHDYWTLDDLLIQGMLVVPFALLALVLVEVLFRGMFRYFESDRRIAGSVRAYRWLLDRPSAMASLLLVVMAAFVAWVGDARGEGKLNEFRDWRLADSQSATVMDGSVLEHVFLVGTTSRTAIFRRVTKWSDDNTDEAHPIDHDVIVMDRALVVCHARGDICKKLPGRKSNGTSEADPAIKRVEDELTSLTASVGTGFGRVLQDMNELNENLRAGFETVDTDFDEVCWHLDRHQLQIIGAIDAARGNLPPGQSSSDHDGGGVAAATMTGTGGYRCPPLEDDQIENHSHGTNASGSVSDRG